MSHEFLVKDIAFQAGLSTATVDRVLNGEKPAVPSAILPKGSLRMTEGSGL